MSEDLFVKNIASDFSDAAHRYNDYAQMQFQIACELADYVIKNSSENDFKLLDIGCGTGFVAKNLQNKYDILQLDIAENMCIEAQKIAPAIRADMHDMPLEDGNFDVVTSSMALQWSDDLIAVINGVFRILKPGGKFICAIPVRGSLYPLDKLFANYEMSSKILKFYTEDEVLTALKKFKVKNYNNKITYYYKNIFHIFNDIKSIGAGNKNNLDNNFISPQKLKKISAQYEGDYGKKDRLPLEWSVMFFCAEKIL